MFYTTIANVAQKRTIKPLYAHHQATPQAFTLDNAWDKATCDILPGMVLVNLGAGEVTLSDGTSGDKSYGLSAHFVAPILGIDEVSGSGIGGIGVWVGGKDSQFSILAPAFDTHADWAAAKTALGNGGEVLLVPGAGTNNRGKLTPAVAEDATTSGYEVKAAADPICKLVDVVSDKEIIVAFVD